MVTLINTKEDNCFIKIESKYQENTTIWYADDVFDTRKRLATYKEGKWIFSLPNNFNDLIILVKQNGAVKRALTESLNHMANHQELTITTKGKCFQRKIKLKFKKQILRIKQSWKN